MIETKDTPLRAKFPRPGIAWACLYIGSDRVAEVFADSVEEVEERAAFIVRACNAHAGLVEAMTDCADGLERDARLYPTGEFPSASRFEHRAAVLRKALDAVQE